MELSWRRRRVRVSALSIAMGVGLLSPVAAQSASPSPAAPSAIGNEMVQWLAVSPAYKQTGLVVALSASLTCYSGKDCAHVWVSRDGGASWHRAAMTDGQPARIVIGTDGKGHDTLYERANAPTAGVLRSDDDGNTWTPVGALGTPAILPSYPTDEGVLVASDRGHDYLLQNGVATSALGSDGAGDLSFMPSPEFPSGGTFSAALLIALNQQTRVPYIYHCNSTVTCYQPTPLPWPADQAGIQAIEAYLLPSADYAEKGSVFAVTPYGIYKSLDGGVTFAPLNIASTSGASITTTNMMALAPGYREAGPIRTAYAAYWQTVRSANSATQSGGIYRTTDGGATWSPFATTGAFAGGAQAVAVAPDGRLFGGYYDGHGHAGLLCSTDGMSWQTSCPAVGNHDRTSGRAGATAGTANSKSGCSDCQAGSAGHGASAANDSAAVGGQGGSHGAPGAATLATSATVGSTAIRWGVIASILAAILAMAAVIRRFGRFKRISKWLGRNAKA